MKKEQLHSDLFISENHVTFEFKMNNMDERKVKQVIVMRKDLKMRKGKMIVQGAHASLDAFLRLFSMKEDIEYVHYDLSYTKKSMLSYWMDGSFAKICVSVDSEEELVMLYDRIVSENSSIPIALIEDAGLTEFHGEITKTCIAIGPYWGDEIDIFTRDLKLL